MSAYQRTKGHNWEREVARRFREALPGIGRCARGLAQTRDGTEVPDVDVDGLYACECKVGKAAPVRPALAQAIKAAPKGSTPIAVIKDDRCDPFVVILFDDFLDLVKTCWELCER